MPGGASYVAIVLACPRRESWRKASHDLEFRDGKKIAKQSDESRDPARVRSGWRRVYQRRKTWSETSAFKAQRLGRAGFTKPRRRLDAMRFVEVGQRHDRGPCPRIDAEAGDVAAIEPGARRLSLRKRLLSAFLVQHRRCGRPIKIKLV
jgi:hypothetical protein